MAASESPEAKELSLVGKVELRIALAESDSKLESLLSTYLAPLLLKLASEHLTVRNKVIAVCQHINTRIKPPTIRLPVTALLKQYKDNGSALIRHFDLLYIQQGLERLPFSDRSTLLPNLIKGIQKNYEESARHTSSLFNMLLRLLHSMKIPLRGSDEDKLFREKLGLNDAAEDAQFVALWIGKLILFSPDQSKKRSPGMTAENWSFLQLYDKKDTWMTGASNGMNLAETKVVAARFLASGAFSESDRFLPALFASADSNSRLSDIGEDMLKRATPAISLEEDVFLNQLFAVYLGDRSNDNSLPARAPLQTKILGLLCRSKRASLYVEENKQIIKEGLAPADEQKSSSLSSIQSRGLENSRLRNQIFAYTNWLARISEGVHIKAIASVVVAQLRTYIESQGWPRANIANSSASISELSLRSLGYESIGILAKASPNELLLDPDLDLLRWLFDSLSADFSGREIHLSIDQALSSVLGAFGQNIGPDIEESLEALLVHQMGLQVGEVLSSDMTIIRSTRFAAVRFANRCLPFSNTTARWINLLAIGDSSNEHNEIIEEGKRGLDPYWYRTLNPAKDEVRASPSSSSKSKYDFPKFEKLMEKLFGPDSSWDTSVPGRIPLPTPNAYGAAVRFCRSILLHEALLTAQMAPIIDGEWERKLETLIVNDEKARTTVREYLPGMEISMGENTPLVSLLSAALTGMVEIAGEGAIVSGDCLLQLCALSPNSAIGILAQDVSRLGSSIDSSQKLLREVASHIFGILTTHEMSTKEAVQKMLNKLFLKSRSWNEATGSQILHIHGALLAQAYYYSRRQMRAASPAADKDTEELRSFMELTLKILITARDKMLIQAAVASIFELCISGCLTPTTLPQTYNVSSLVEKLGAEAKSGNETAVKTLGAFAMQCNEDLSDGSEFSQILGVLHMLHEQREPTTHFAVGEALSYATIGWQSKALIVLFDIPSPPPATPLRINSPGQIMERILRDCKNTKPAMRQASVIWLLSFVQFCGHITAVQDKLRDCQSAFKGFLADRESLNQETASRGLSLIYEKGSKELKDDLIRDLVGSFTGTNANLAGSVSADTQLFEPGALPTGDGSITTYKDIMSLAAEVGNPSLVYQFMSLASNNAIWSSRAAFGRFGLSSILSDSSVDGYLAQNPKVYPALFRYRFDPNTNVRNAMNDIWSALVRDPTTTIDTHFNIIISDLLKNIVGKEWRTRQACCAAIADLVQGRPSEKYQEYIGEIWTLTFKVCDDIKESVRTAAMALARVLVGNLTRSLEAGDSTTRNAGSTLENVLPFLLSPSGLESPAEDVQAFSLSALLQIIKKSPRNTLRPFVPDLVGRLILLLSSLEPQAIEYVRLRAEHYGVTGQQIDDARLSGVRGSPMLESIERCLDFLDEQTMRELQKPLENAITTALGLPSRVGGSRVLVSLSTRHNFIFSPHANYFLKLARKQVLDRNETISASYSAACGYLARLASDEEILNLTVHCRKLYFDADEERHRVVAGDIVYAISKYATDRFNSLASDILPFVFLAKQDSYERAKGPFQDAWNENVGGSRTVQLYMGEIIQLAMQYLESPRWSLKHTAALTVAEAVNSSGEDISDTNAQILWPGIEKAIDGKTWNGKETVLTSFVKYAKAKNAITADEKVWAQLQKIILRESKRNNPQYRQHALSCLGDYVELRDTINIFAQVCDITAPIIESSLASADDMDLDSQSGGPSTKAIAEETLANALRALLRSINPQYQTSEDLALSLSRALALAVKTLSESGSRIVRNSIYDAEKALFQKMGKRYSGNLPEIIGSSLVGFVQTLFQSGDQVEQTRLKAAEVASTMASLGSTNELLRRTLIDGINRARAEERSVSVQQCLDRAKRAMVGT